MPEKREDNLWVARLIDRKGKGPDCGEVLVLAASAGEAEHKAIQFANRKYHGPFHSDKIEWQGTIDVF
jgi:hypothetical protein